MAILKTQNDGYGFYGTAIIIVGHKGVENLWDEAFKAIKKKTGLKDEMVRELLDSRWGRYTADELYTDIMNDDFTKAFMKKYSKDDIIKIAKEIEKELQD